MSNQIPAMLFMFLGFIMLVLTANGMVYHKKIAYVVSSCILCLGIVLSILSFLNLDRIIAFLMCTIFGGFALFMGMQMVLTCFSYQKAGLGTLVAYNKSRYVRKQSEPYVTLVFSYSNQGIIVQADSDDTFKQHTLHKKYKLQEQYPIWCHKHNPKMVRLKRFNGCFAGLFLTGMGSIILLLPFGFFH